MIDIIMTISSSILLTIQVTAGYPPNGWNVNQSDSSDEDDSYGDLEDEDHSNQVPEQPDESHDLILYPIPRGGVQAFFSRFGLSCPTSDSD